MRLVEPPKFSLGKRCRGLIKLLLLIVIVILQSFASAENIPVNHSGSTSEITQNTLKAKIDELNSKKGVNEDIKSQLLSLYGSAQDYLAITETYLAKTVEYDAAIKEAPDKTKKLQRDIEQTQQKAEKQRDENFSNFPIEELEQRLILEKEKINSLGEDLQKLDKELSIQNERPQQIRQETIAAQQALEDAQRKLENHKALGIKPDAEARQIQQSTIINSRKAELKMLSAEANSNPFRVELLKSQVQLIALQKDQLSPVITTIENIVNARRMQEAKHLENELAQAEKTTSGKHQLIIETTRENIQYSRDLQLVTSKIESYNELKNKIDNTSNQIEADFKSAEKKISLAGLSPVLGKILREQRRNLANPERLLSTSDEIQDETAFSSLEQFKIEDELKRLSDTDVFLQSLVNQQVEASLPSNDRMMIQAQLRVLLNNQKELLSKLSLAYATYLRMLGDVDFSKQQMLLQATKFAAYLDERLLWVPSSTPINSTYLSGLYESIKWLLSPINWMTFFKDILRVAWQNPFLTFLAFLGAIVLPMLRRWAKQELQIIANKIDKIYTDNFSYTFKALTFTLILVLPIPIFVYYLGWFLSGNLDVANFSKSIGIGLQSVAIPFFVFQLLYRLFAIEGIAIKHFQWQKSTAALLQRQLAWFRFFIIPGVFLINSTGASTLSSHGDHLGRLALIINMIALSVFFSRLLDPNTGLLKDYIKTHPNDMVAKLRYIWFPLIHFIPLIVVGFASVGYYLSGLELQQKLIITIRFVFCLVIIYGLVIRWLTLVNRQLALKNARQKRKAAVNEKQPSLGAEGFDDLALPIDEKLIDIPTINAQTVKLLVLFIGLSLFIGFWLIWNNILPAFSFLEQIVLWQHPTVVDNQEVYQPVTLTNLLRAGLYIFIIVVSVRNFSGLIELLAFSRIAVTAGGRYAVNQLATYLILAIGFISIANELGGSWSQVQWLVAALSVGLGFGLQEIFANLVSGIIILFERPLQVGDTVTINNVSGKVSRIQMRATTIMDWDHKEHIVPNKTFITNQLVNWTLSDTTTRVVIPISIAYGSNAELAYQLILDVARSTPMVLEDPPPSVNFMGIKDAGLEFSIMVFVSELGHRLQVTHNLNLKLEKMLRENNFELPCIQRDVPVST